MGFLNIAITFSGRQQTYSNKMSSRRESDFARLEQLLREAALCQESTVLLTSRTMAVQGCGSRRSSAGKLSPAGSEAIGIVKRSPPKIGLPCTVEFKLGELLDWVTNTER